MSTTKITGEQVRQILETNMESEEPDAILAILKKQEGKQLTKRTLALLPGGEERWRIRTIAGMTNLEDRDYLMNNGRKGTSFLMAYQVKNVTIDTTFFVERNPAYFKGRIERNAKRREALRTPATINDAFAALNKVADAVEALEKAKAELAALTSYGEILSPDQYEWERLAGIREESK